MMSDGSRMSSTEAINRFAHAINRSTPASNRSTQAHLAPSAKSIYFRQGRNVGGHFSNWGKSFFNGFFQRTHKMNENQCRNDST